MEVLSVRAKNNLVAKVKAEKIYGWATIEKQKGGRIC